MRAKYALRIGQNKSTLSGKQYSFNVPPEIGEELEAARLTKFAIEVDADGIHYRPVREDETIHKGLRALISKA